jgi:hypothetical protein
MVLLVEHIAARDGLSPIMLLLRAVWESPSRVNIAARPNLTARTLLILVTKEQS